jgi:hypothetical protein
MLGYLKGAKVREAYLFDRFTLAGLPGRPLAWVTIVDVCLDNDARLWVFVLTLDRVVENSDAEIQVLAARLRGREVYKWDSPGMVFLVQCAKTGSVYQILKDEGSLTASRYLKRLVMVESGPGRR